MIDVTVNVPVTTIGVVGAVLYLLVRRWASTTVKRLADQNVESLAVVDGKRCHEKSVARYRMNEAQQLQREADEYFRKHFLVQAIGSARLGLLRSADALHWAQTDPKRRMPKVILQGKGRKQRAIVVES